MHLMKELQATTVVRVQVIPQLLIVQEVHIAMVPTRLLVMVRHVSDSMKIPMWTLCIVLPGFMAEPTNTVRKSTS